MGERYERWLTDPVAKTILEGYKANNLSVEAQEAFELLIDNIGISIPRTRYRKIIGVLRNELNQPSEVIKNLVSNFKTSVRDSGKWPGKGTDPIIYLRENS